MKKQYILCGLFMLTTIAHMSSQTATPAKAKSTTTTKETKPVAAKQELITVDLSPIGINATMKAPASVKAVEGKYSNSIVGDNNFEISVEETSTNFVDTKQAISADKANVITVSGDKSFIYTTSMMGKNMAHFECVMSVGGVLYRFYDKRVLPLNQAALMPMYEAAKSITEK